MDVFTFRHFFLAEEFQNKIIIKYITKHFFTVRWQWQVMEEFFKPLILEEMQSKTMKIPRYTSDKLL